MISPSHPTCFATARFLSNSNSIPSMKLTLRADELGAKEKSFSDGF